MESKRLLEPMRNGKFLNKLGEEALNFLESTAELTRGWEESAI